MATKEEIKSGKDRENKSSISSEGLYSHIASGGSTAVSIVGEEYSSRLFANRPSRLDLERQNLEIIEISTTAWVSLFLIHFAARATSSPLPTLSSFGWLSRRDVCF